MVGAISGSGGGCGFSRGHVSTGELPPPPTDDDAPHAVDRTLPTRRIEADLARGDQQARAALDGRLTVGKDQVVKSTLANVLAILQHDPRLRGVFGWDERAEHGVLLKPLPIQGQTEHMMATPRPIEDSDETRLYKWLSDRWGIDPKPHNVHLAMMEVIGRKRFDAVRDYLDSLRGKWDHRDRLDSAAQVYLGAEPTAFSSVAFRKWLISAVARVYEPGCKADHVLVLEGEQGLGKSTALRILAGDEHFGDDIPALGGKDAQQYLGGFWIVELAEMDAATKAESATLKRFLTTTVDNYRPPYGRWVIKHGRRCVFAGSVNHDEYLKDSTGGRRFWPVRCNHIDLAALKADRDQLWAEAVHAYRRGEPWHLTLDSHIEEAKSVQSERLERDIAWQEAIEEWLSHPQNKGERTVTTRRLLNAALQVEDKHITRREQLRVSAIMHSLGWGYGKDVNRQKCWVRPLSHLLGEKGIGDNNP